MLPLSLDKRCEFARQIPILRPPEQHPTVADLGEPLADVSLLPILGVHGAIGALVFDYEDAPIVQLGNEVG